LCIYSCAWCGCEQFSFNWQTWTLISTKGLGEKGTSTRLGSIGERGYSTQAGNEQSVKKLDSEGQIFESKDL
jgi:hypothetical protein